MGSTWYTLSYTLHITTLFKCNCLVPKTLLGAFLPRISLQKEKMKTRYGPRILLWLQGGINLSTQLDLQYLEFYSIIVSAMQCPWRTTLTALWIIIIDPPVLPWKWNFLWQLSSKSHWNPQILCLTFF